MGRPIARAAAWAGLLALALAACGKAPGPQAQADSPAYRQQVIDYLLKHPDVIEEAAGRYDQQQQAVAMAAARRAIPAHRDALDHDPMDFVANPDGKITVVEFFDYRCPYCKSAQPALEDLIRGNRDVRFVFKEFPILPDANGQIGVSERAALAAIAAGRQGKYVPVHNALMSEKAVDDAAISQVLRANGVDPAQAGPTPDVVRHLGAVRRLAASIGATGTPVFVVGDTLIEGARMDDLTAAIAKARASQRG
jgi:protein-disulfide isomerase